MTLEQERDVVRLMPIARHLARRRARTVPNHVPLDDLLQAAYMGVVEAVLNWKPDGGCSLEGYAWGRVRGAILDWLRSNDHVSRLGRGAWERGGQTDIDRDWGVPAQAYLEPCSLDALATLDAEGEPVSLRDVIAGDASAEDEAIRRDDIRRGLAAMTDRERRLVLAEVMLGAEHIQLAAALGVSGSRVSQILSAGRQRAVAALAA